MIIAVFVLSVILAVFLLTTDIRHQPIRYFGMMWILIGLGCVKPIIEEYLGPHFWIASGSGVPFVWQSFGVFCSVLALHLAPFYYLMFALACSGFLDRVDGLVPRKMVKLFILLIPLISFGVVLPRSLRVYSDNRNFLLLSIWTVPYLAAGVALFSCAYRKAVGKRAKQQALLLCHLAIPTGIVSLFTCYVLRAFGFHHAWVVNRWFVLATFIFYLYVISHYGLLGIKLRIEKKRLDTTLKAVVSGTSILNHTVKNEVLKIILSATDIQGMKERNSSACEEDLQVILNSARHLEAMAHRIKATMHEIVLTETGCDVAGLIEKAIRLVSPDLAGKQVKIVKEDWPKIIMRCDETQMVEVLANLLQNAIEAFPPAIEGEIRIKVENTKNHMLLLIRDNGAGISPEVLPFIMDPFFSTKGKHVNYGLGLSYCYRVLQKHGGTIEIESEPKVGTTVWLAFPAWRISCPGQMKAPR